MCILFLGLPHLGLCISFELFYILIWRKKFTEVVKQFVLWSDEVKTEHLGQNSFYYIQDVTLLTMKKTWWLQYYAFLQKAQGS